jgi:hypothetical protein
MSFPPNPSTGGGGGSFVINDDHFFADDTARDAYFVLHPDELETGTLIYVDPGYQQYNGSSWVDVTAVVTGPQGDPGEDADNVWGTLTGTLNDQTDLKNALDAKIPTSQKGAASGVAELNSSGIVPTAQLPSYVDDVVEYANAAALPATGESGKIYFTLDDGKQFRWGGTTYVEIITGGVALGETSDTAYRGDRGKIAYDHSVASHAPWDAEKNINADWNATEGDALILNKPAIPSEYTLPTASADTLGGVKIGSGITITDGVISASALENVASKTESDLTLYVYEDATGDADGSSKTNGFTTLQAAIDAIPDVAKNVTIIVSKGSTNYLGDTTVIQKASVKSLTIRGEFYAYEACDSNAVVGKVVDASADFSDFEVGDRVVCTKYSGTVGASSIEDYFYATITEVGSGYIQTSEGTKVPTTGWKYLINQTAFDGNNGTADLIASEYFGGRLNIYGICQENTTGCGISATSTTTSIYACIFSDIKAIVGYFASDIIFNGCGIVSGVSNVIALNYGATVNIANSVVSGASAQYLINLNTCSGIKLSYSGLFGGTYAIAGSTSDVLVYALSCYIASTCTYGAYGYNITLVSCTNNAVTPVYNLTSGGSIEEWDGQALPSIDDATGGQVLALKSDKSALEFATVDLDTLSAEPKSNLIINGDFSVAQRGTSFVSDSWRANNDDSYLLDRWLLVSDGNDIVDVTQIESPFSRSRYALQAEVETANKRFGFCQIIEANTCIPLRGKNISISFAAKTVTDKLVGNVRVAVLEWTSTADTVTSDVVADWASDLTFATNWAALNTPANLALTTSEQTFKVENLTVGASCNNLAVFVWVDDTDCAADDILQLGEVQLVRGSVVPEFVATWDLDNCLRFYFSLSGKVGVYDYLSSIKPASSTTLCFVMVYHKKIMRVTPSLILPTAYTNFGLSDGITAFSVLSGNPIFYTNGSNTRETQLECRVASGLTQFRPYALIAANQIADTMGLEAEL